MRRKIYNWLRVIYDWFVKSHRLEWQRFYKIGRVNAQAGMEQVGCRDFDITICWLPLWYFTFQLSIWYVYIGCGWSRNPDTYADCDHEESECFACGCKNTCGNREADSG